MTSRRRKILFLFFILIFFALTPVVLFYAAGYRINWTWPPRLDQTFQKTGMLVLETEPAGANIYINEELQKNFFGAITLSGEEERSIRTPAKIKYVTPGQYQVRLEKEGYWPWEKKLRIHPGQQTKLENITLFEKSLPLKIFKGSLQQTYTSPDKKYIVLPRDDLMIDLTKETATALENFHGQNGTTTFNSGKLIWSKNSQKFLRDLTVYNINDMDDPVDLKEELSNDAENFKWRDSSILYYQSRNSIRSFDLDSRSGKEILTTEGEMINYFPQEDYFYTITNKEVRSSLNIYPADPLEKENALRRIELPYSTGYTFAHLSHDQISIYDENYDILYFIDPFSLINPVRNIIENVRYFDQIDNKLLYANKFEIWTYDPAGSGKTLLTRISDPIIGISWHPSAKYIFYYTDTGIHVIEAGKRSQRNITTLIKVNEIRSPIIREEGNLIYFTAKIGRSTGLYKLNL